MSATKSLNKQPKRTKCWPEGGGSSSLARSLRQAGVSTSRGKSKCNPRITEAANYQAESPVFLPLGATERPWIRGTVDNLLKGLISLHLFVFFVTSSRVRNQQGTNSLLNRWTQKDFLEVDFKLIDHCGMTVIPHTYIHDSVLNAKTAHVNSTVCKFIHCYLTIKIKT
jgi:hypothetical protein